MKGIYLIFILSIICQPLLFSQVVVKRNNQVSKEAANVNWSKEYTLFDYTTDEPIFPLIRNGQPVYKIYYASKEDPRPNYGEFSIAQVEGLKYYKFKNRETCFKFCLANKLNAVPTLTTTSIASITTTTATSGGIITADGGTSITARGVVWSTSTNPTIILTTKTSNGTGTGSFSSSLTNLTPKTTYYVRAYAINSAGTGYGNEITFTTSDSSSVMGIPCPGTPTVKDIDGNTYNTVQIGTQCWTKENLRVTKYRDGMVIPLDESGGTTGYGTGQTWSFRTTGARTLIGPNSIYLTTYGYLYNWYAVTNTKGLCPNGWYIPSDAEWTTLITYLGGESIAGGKMKSIGTVYWNSPNSDATNESGFSALPGGFRDNGGSFSSTSYGAFFWSATEYEADNAWYRRIDDNYGNVKRYSSSEQNGFSIRCIKDTIFIVSIPTLTTTTITAITTTSATSGGVITSDGGASISARGVVWSTSTNPTIALSTKTADGTGTGSFTSLLTNLTPKTTYYVRAYATNSAGTGYGNEITFTTAEAVMNIPCPGTPTVKDIDGNTYNTVQIGTQCWTRENLRVTKYRDGSVIPLDESGGTNGGGTGQTWSSRTTGARTVYAHSATNLATYGYLYNWYAVADTKGLCPSGWNIPSETDWQFLVDYLGINNGDKLRDTIWWIPSVKSSNESGLSVKFGGYRDTSYFSNESNSGNFWSSSKKSNIIWNETENLGLALWYKGNLEKRYTRYDISGLSMRCIKLSESNISLPSLSTSSATSISINSAISGGTIYSDGGSPVTSRGVVWSNNPNPTTSLSTKTTDYKGTGSFVSSIDNLKSNTTYYLRAYASNITGTIYGNEIIFTTQDSVMNIPCPGTTTVKDIDGNTYNTVQIGTQCWIKENLKVTKYRDGTIIPLDESGGTTGNGSGQVWSSRSIGTRTVYGHAASNLLTYGYLYNWYAVADEKGLCPRGWHVPDNTEWTNLTNYLGREALAGGKMKTTGTTFWNSPNSGASNESGFSVLPSGYRYHIGGFYSMNENSFFWSFNELDNINAWILQLNYDETNTKRYDFIKRNGVSVRCLKDTSSIVSIPTLTTTSISAITTTTATSGGNITSDGGASITARGIVWSTSTNPTINLTTKTSNGTGTGSFSSSLTNLITKTTYYVRAYASNSAGTGYGNEITFTTTDSTSVMGIPCPGTPTVKDIDGNTYNTVQIGTQCWTKENLRVTKYRDGSVIPLDESGGISGKEGVVTWTRNTGARTVYANSSANFDTYGYLYNWYAVADKKGICPIGWHVPSDGEWSLLTSFLGGDTVAGGKMKTIGMINWQSPNTGATNESGFSALPGGFRLNDIFVNIKLNAYFWTTTENNNTFAWYRGLDYYYGKGVDRRDNLGKPFGVSIRCLKDTFSIVSIPTLTTTDISAISATSATSGGNITSDGGAAISARGVVWSTITNPTIALSTKTSNGTGIGSYTSSLTNLTPKTTYYVRAYANNSAGTGYGNEITFTTTDSSIVMGIPCPGTPTVKDIDGNTYNTVQIGTQCWTKENLRVTKYKDGSIIPLDESGGTTGNGTGQTWSSRTTGARTVSGHNISNLATYGYLYNWYAVADTKGLCPSGWHVPSDLEWSKLINFIDGTSIDTIIGWQSLIAGRKLKAKDSILWSATNLEISNETGFSGLPGGYRLKDGSFHNNENDVLIAFFWSSTENLINSWYRTIYSDNNNVNRYHLEKIFGGSVRCLKDTFSIVSIPSLSTTAISSITTTTATSGGNSISDGGASISARGVVWSTTANPTINLNTKTSNGTGTGSFTSTLTNLTPKTTYYVRAYAINSAGTGYGNEITFTTTDSSSVMGIPCPGTPTVKDIDGNTYNTVQIGTQCWTKENLRVTKYRDGSDIPLDESGGTIGDEFGEKWSSQYDGARTVLGHSASNLTTYGYLYNWYAIKNQKGICPDGWHPPNNREWNILNEFLGGEFISGNKLKDTIWRNITPDNISTNESGFSALPGGWRTSTGFFPSSNRPDREGIFWSLSDTIDFYEFAWYRKLVPTNIGNRFISEKQSKFAGFSVRCLKDSPTIVSIPTLTTTTVTSITNASATSGGNITTDGGATITARGVVWSTSTNPTISLSTKTSNGTETGSFTSTLTNLTPKTTCYVRAYATNSAGTGYGNEISFTTSDSSNVMGTPCPGAPTVKDVDGNTYNTVQVGTQCWTKENLRVTKYRDGTVIPLDESGGTTGNGTGQTWGNRTAGARTVYGHSAANLATYGYLYNWYAAVDSKGLCPSGWHLPSDAEWTMLTNYLGGESIAGGKMKFTGTTYWDSPNTGATNESGFSALPGGDRNTEGSFGNFIGYALFWSSTKITINFTSNYAWNRILYYDNGNVGRRSYYSKSSGASVRCLRD